MKKITRTLRKHRLVIACGFLCFMFFLQQSCTKIDTSAPKSGIRQLSNAEITQKFFNVPANVPQAVKRAAEKMKTLNAANEYVIKFVEENGYPVWDKASVKVHAQTISSSFASTTGGPQQDTSVVLPLVPDPGKLVTGFIAARMNGDVILNLYRGGDYSVYSFDDVRADSMSADKAAAQLMVLNRDVFGYTDFIVKDNRLFSNKTTFSLPESHNERVFHLRDTTPAGNNVFFYSSCNICVDWWCVICLGMDPRCPMGGKGTDCYVATCVYDDGIPAPGNDPTGGGGGGSNPPTPFPCPSTQGRNTTIIPCTPPPAPPVIVFEELSDPCDEVVMGLKTNTAFSGRFADLNDPSVFGIHREAGFAVRDIIAGNYLDNVFGPIDTPRIDWPFVPGEQIDGKIHTHFDGTNSIFSPADLLAMADACVKGLARDSSKYFEGMTSRQGGPFIIKISNASKFMKWARKMQDKKMRDRFKAATQNATNYIDNPIKNEKGFLEILSTELGNCVSLFKGNAACTDWTKRNLRHVAGDYYEVDSEPCE